MNITKVTTPTNKYYCKCPYPMSPIGITIHNTANDASAMSEISYMLGNDYYTSFHFAVDDVRAVQGIELNRNAFHASDGSKGTGNRKTIAIEICYSKSGGSRFTKAEENAAELCAMLCKQYGWTTANIKRHYDYAPDKKYCPHRTMDLGWTRFLNLVNSKMGNASNSKTEIIKDLQRALNSLGEKLDVDGSKGPLTNAALKRHYCKLGDKNELVKFVQKRLVAKNYSIGNCGVDGSYGYATRNAVLKYQKNKGLVQDGYAGYNTISNLCN